jgi:arsenite-transporting ATPase
MVLGKLRKKERSTVYYFFSGKGGVGKTSTAAATALHFAQKGNKTLIISTDPAHSLSDSFDKQIGGEVKKLSKNLFGVEIDPKKALQEYKSLIEPQLGKIDALKGMGLEETFDIAETTPGIDEMAAFDKFLKYMHSKEYDIIVFDTAPTGHALRFLSLPDVLDSWVGKIIKLKMRFGGMMNLVKKVIPFGDDQQQEGFGTEQLDAMKQRIDDARIILTNPERTHYNIVTIPEQMSILESERAIKAIKAYSIPVETVIVNKIIPDNKSCSFCSEKRREQQERMKIIRDKFGRLDIKKVEMFRKEVRGFPALEKLSKVLYK